MRKKFKCGKILTSPMHDMLGSVQISKRKFYMIKKKLKFYVYLYVMFF
jgi:hypothetical protein